LKKVLLVVAVWLSVIAFNAGASDSYIGGDLTLASYPNAEWGSKIKNAAYADGATYAYASDPASKVGLGVYGGQWLNENVGWEVGYDNLSSDKASVNVLKGGNNGFGNYQYAITALHASVLGGIQFGKSTFFGKLGYFNSSSELSGVEALTGASFSKTASGSGYLIGVGYRFPYSDKLFGRYGVDVFKGVVLTDIVDYAKTTSADVVKLYFGLDYLF
jgi:hypothetical protein